MNFKRSVKLATSALLMVIAGMAGTAQAEAPVMNGIAYVLLSKDFENHGVFRLNDYTNGNPLLTTENKLFNLNTMTGKVSGLAVNQQKQVFLLSSTSGGSWEDAPVGWLPTGMKFEADSPIYLKIVKPNDAGMTEYIRPGTPHMSSATEGSHWKRNFTIAGKSYKYAVNFGGPNEVRYLNGLTTGPLGTPIWDGTFSATSGLAHETDGNKVILPSHYAGVAYYAYGTKNHPEFPGEALDGTIGRNGNIKPLTLWSEGDAGHQSPNTLFSCIVKRIYKQRRKTLDLFAATDNNPCTSPGLQSSGMLSSMDVDVTEAYGKYCGDNCIPGGSIGQNSILTKLSTVTVVTSTKGSRYGFNPQGIRKGPFSADTSVNAALRVVLASNVTNTVPYDISADDDGQIFSSVITNGAYLQSIGVTPSNLKVIGVSSDFSNPAGLDYIYGSAADKFVVQDSWWGRGGVAYEYFEDTGVIQKLDYVSNNSPAAEPLGVLSGKVDDIAIDGDGYLYVLRTEKVPADDAMSASLVDKNDPSVCPEFDSISGWKRTISKIVDGETVWEVVDVADGTQQVGDFKIVTLKQQVLKTVKRYPQGTGSLGAEEDRGAIKAGYDYWTRDIVLQAGNATAWKTAAWSVEAEGSKNSNIPGELAVVNLAKIPANFPGTSGHHVVVTNGASPDNSFSSTADNPSINEHDTLTFKVEGYKPYINGRFQDFKAIGDIVNPDTNAVLHSNVLINAIPNADGEYRHDENGDGAFSGFPSNMFESSSRKTVFSWSVDWVEGNSVDDAKVLKNLVTAQSGTGDIGAFSYKFPHPGNYIVKAQITYNYFTFPTTPNSRPHELTANATTVTTSAFMVKVVAKSLNLNNSPSFITNISLKPASRQYMADVAPATKGADSKIDFAEDTTFSGIAIEFDAQFVRDANFQTNVEQNMETYDGIGVWDYRYYARLYNEIPNLFPGMPYAAPTSISEPGNEAASAHVYNYNPAGDFADIKTKINAAVFNPGRPKGATPGVEHGTRLDEDPNDKDWAFVQWALYLRPVSPYQTATPTSSLGADVRHERGTLVARGSCADPGVTRTALGDRKFSVRTVVPASALRTIKTPKDPEMYTLNLEIVYPRVSWVANDLGDGKNEKRFSSMIPLYADENSLSTNHAAGTNPIHILSRMRLTSGNSSEPASNFVVNQSWKYAGTTIFAGDNDSINVLARDVTLPTLVQASGDNPTPVIQTTGDDVTDVRIGFAAYDNNPHAEFKDFFAAYQTLRDQANFLDNTDANKQFKAEAKIEGSNVSVIRGSEDSGYYEDNNWTNGASYTTLINEYGPNGPFQKGKDFQNWIGTLNYTVMGSVYDGIGSDARDITHQFYHPQACQDLAIDVDAAAQIALDSSLIKAVERFDNDPPSLEIELVSQVDNRRWVIRLDENIADAGPVPTDPAQLGKCTLSVKCYNLQDKSEVSSFANDTIEGCAGYPSQIGENKILVTDVFADAVPKFRRASRLLINLHVFDNTGFRSLSEAALTVEDQDGATTRNLMPSNSPSIPLIPSLNTSGVIINGLDTKPRASYAVDMPMKVNGEKQVKIEFKAKDQDNNERIITIPVTVVESTFETRVLEIKENKN